MNKIEELYLNGDRIFLRKVRNTYRVVYPIKIDGKISWKNLIAGGNWLNLLKIGFIIVIILGCIWEYSQAKAIADYCLNNPFGRF